MWTSIVLYQMYYEDIFYLFVIYGDITYIKVFWVILYYFSIKELNQNCMDYVMLS